MEAYGVEIPQEPESMKVPASESVEYQAFLRCMANRRAVGSLRYGRISRRQKYLSRLKKELKAYCRDGNMEQLLNIANYAFLESAAPEHRNFHFDNTVDSVTRNTGGK